MSAFQEKFDRAVLKVVINIKIGRVMSYGDVARMAGYPRHARMVSKAMSRSSTELPWYRVVRSNGTLAFEAGSEAYKKQSMLLSEEGVKIVNGKIIPTMTDDDTPLDELLWGAPK